MTGVSSPTYIIPGFAYQIQNDLITLTAAIRNKVPRSQAQDRQVQFAAQRIFGTLIAAAGIAIAISALPSVFTAALGLFIATVGHDVIIMANNRESFNGARNNYETTGTILKPLIDVNRDRIDAYLGKAARLATRAATTLGPILLAVVEKAGQAMISCTKRAQVAIAAKRNG